MGMSAETETDVTDGATETKAEADGDIINTVNLLTALGFLSGGFAVLVLPIVFGPIGVVCGIAAIYYGGLWRGLAVIVWSIVMAIVGMVLGVVLGVVWFWFFA